MSDSVEKEIMLINQIIRNAEMNGADCGGSYSSNIPGLIKSMNQYLEYKGLTKEYSVKETLKDGWSIYQFIEK